MDTVNIIVGNTTFKMFQFNGPDWSLLVKHVEIEDLHNQGLCISSI